MNELTQFYYPEDSMPIEERVECFLYERRETIYDL